MSLGNIFCHVLTVKLQKEKWDGRVAYKGWGNIKHIHNIKWFDKTLCRHVYNLQLLTDQLQNNNKKLSYRRRTARRAVSVETVRNVAQTFVESGNIYCCKSVKIWQNYGHEFVASLFWPALPKQWNTFKITTISPFNWKVNGDYKSTR